MDKDLKTAIFSFIGICIFCVGMYFADEYYFKPYIVRKAVEKDLKILNEMFPDPYSEDFSKCSFETALYFQNKTVNLQTEIIFHEKNKKLTDEEIVKITSSLREVTDNTIFSNDSIVQTQIIVNLNSIIRNCVNARYVISRFE